VAARENQAQPVIRKHFLFPITVRPRGDLGSLRDLFRFAPESLIAAQAIDGFVPCRADQPGTRIRGRPRSRPFLQRNRIRFLQHFFRQIKIA
jgi:hypothetical protein